MKGGGVMDIERIASDNRLDENGRAQLLGYIRNRFEGCAEQSVWDTGFLEKWEKIIRYADENGAAGAINKLVCPQRPVEFNSPDSLEIQMFDSFAGKLPVIYVRDTADFEQLVTNAAYKGVRPDNISQTGASFISGKTTRFAILSAKPYSNVPAEDLGLGYEEWAEKSISLRRGHECTHYFTKQVFGITDNNVHDELIADFIGLHEAFGFYRAEWFLRFMGITGNSGGRLIFYTKDLMPNVREAVSDLLTTAAYRLEEWSGTKGFRALSEAERIKLLCRKGLLRLTDAI